MPSDAPDTSRAALEARARYYEEWAQDIRRHSGKSVDADYADATAATLRALAARVVELEARMARLQALVGEQAEDEGLWFLARTCPEGYLQQELRRLHAAVENWPTADGGKG